jgi:hypothetical protein
MSGQKRPPLNRHERRSKKHRTTKEIPVNQPQAPRAPHFDAEVTVKFRPEFHDQLGPEQTFRRASVGNDEHNFIIMQHDRQVIVSRSAVLMIDVVPSRIVQPEPQLVVVEN